MARGVLPSLPLLKRKQRLKTMLTNKRTGAHTGIRYLEHFTAAPDAILESARHLIAHSRGSLPRQRR
jgi:hypothetical protein